MVLQHTNVVLQRLQEEIRELGTQKEWAARHNFSTAYVNDVLHGRREVSDALAAALGFKRVTLWEDTRQVTVSG